MISMKKKNIPITFGIIFGVGTIAYIVNLILDYNYMFLMNHDGTPYVLIYNLVNGNKILYPTSVMLLFVVYIFLFYTIYLKIQAKKNKQDTIPQSHETKLAAAESSEDCSKEPSSNVDSQENTFLRS